MNTLQLRERIELLNKRLLLYLKAEQAILAGQSYQIEGLELTRPNLLQVQNMIRALTNDIAALTDKLNRTNKHSRVIRPAW